MNEDEIRLLALETVELEARERVEESFREIQHVVFVETGLVSILFKGRGDDQAEIALVGFEGCSGCSVILGSTRTPQGMTVQVGGRARRTTVENLYAAMAQSDFLRTLLLHYVHTMIIQRDETALAASKGTLLQRLARWLLMTQDRLQSDHLPLTHDLIALMLSVRRAGVTTALGELKKTALIETNRRDIRIADREGLIELAGPYYGAAETEFDRLYGADFQRK